MPFETVVYLAFVLAALGVFAAALTYADWATRYVDNVARKPAQVRQAKSSDRDTGTERKAA